MVGRNMSLKNPVKPPGIDPGTFRLVAQHLNHLTPGPCCSVHIVLTGKLCKHSHVILEGKESRNLISRLRSCNFSQRPLRQVDCLSESSYCCRHQLSYVGAFRNLIQMKTNQFEFFIQCRLYKADLNWDWIHYVSSSVHSVQTYSIKALQQAGLHPTLLWQFAIAHSSNILSATMSI